ncbi:MAG: DUF1653 domain-containing protein [Lachnospiraceae bacterium]|nr:DUF1653 domain-containing protein [Lachnospiraceae bacterium]
MRNNPKPYEIYEHFKGNRYQIITLAQHSETGEDMVVYQALYGEYKMYVRPLSQFMGMVDEKKYPEQKGQYRFQKVNEEISEEKEQKRAAESVVEEALEAASGPDVEEALETVDPEGEAVMNEAGIDPMVMDFLDADTYEERLNILAALHHRITDDMINTMAISVDVEIEDGPIETRYEELKHCLVTFQKYQCSRMR